MLVDIKTKGGVTTISRKRLTKRIRAIDGTWRTLVSLDGVTWVSESLEKEIARSLQSSINLHGKKWEKAKKKEFDARINPGVQTDVWLNPVPKHGSPMIGKAKGKAQKFRRNLRRKKEKLPKVMKPVHFHTCPDETHPYWRRRFSCSCERKAAKHVYCGVSKCLYSKGESK